MHRAPHRCVVFAVSDRLPHPEEEPVDEGALEHAQRSAALHRVGEVRFALRPVVRNARVRVLRALGPGREPVREVDESQMHGRGERKGKERVKL